MYPSYISPRLSTIPHTSALLRASYCLPSPHRTASVQSLSHITTTSLAHHYLRSRAPTIMNCERDRLTMCLDQIYLWFDQSHCLCNECPVWPRQRFSLSMLSLLSADSNPTLAAGQCLNHDPYWPSRAFIQPDRSTTKLSGLQDVWLQ